MINKIVVPVRGDGKGDNVVIHASRLAHRYGCNLTITHCRARPQDLLPYGIPIPAFMQKQLKEQATSVAEQLENQLKAEIDVLAEQLDLKFSDKPEAGSPSITWVEEAGRQVDVIKRHGRLADLIAVAQPDVDKNLGTNTLRAALFHTGRPVMMCPAREAVAENLGSHIAIAWNGSLESSRAVAMTGPMLAAADKVTVLSGGQELHGAGTEDLIQYLKLRGIEAELISFQPGSSVGLQLVEQANATGADMMVMGAYGESHERETLFGGNTQAAVDGADLPVVFVH